MATDIDKVFLIYKGLLENPSAGLPGKIYMVCYSKVYNYLTQDYNNKGHLLYERYNTLVSDYIATLVEQAEDKSGQELLRFYSSKWGEFTLSNRCINGMMAYLNRTWIKQQRGSNDNIHEIINFGDVIWKDKMFRKIGPRLTSILMDMIRKVREGQEIQDSLISHTIDCYLRISVGLDLYIEFFQTTFLEETSVFYKGESQTQLNQSDIGSYLRYVENKISTEKQRAEKYRYNNSIKVLENVLNDRLIVDHLEPLRASVSALLSGEKTEDLARMYRLFARIDPVQGLTSLAKLFENYVISTGRATISTEKPDKPEDFVEILLRIYRKFNSYVTDLFESEVLFRTAMDKAFEQVVNENALTKIQSQKGDANSLAVAPQYLARYCDLVLRKGSQVANSEDEMERVLDDLVELFKFISDKDIFMMSYQKLMAKRMIGDMSASDSAETAVINKLRTHQGFEYCSKLQRMIQDIHTSRDTHSAFQEYCQSNSLSFGFSYSVKVLAHGVWPMTAPTSSCLLPSEITAAMTAFGDYYKGVKQGRKLTYLHQLSKVQLRAHHLMKGRLMLQTTTYQAAVLMLFNDSETVTYESLLSATQIEPTVLKIALLGLLKVKVLLCDQNDHETWNNDTVFKLNYDLKLKRLMLSCVVPVNAGTLKSSPTPKVEAPEVKQERDYKLRATIVRIMKSRRTINHNELFSEIISQMASLFKPTIPMIKENIEYLIENEYMSRSSDNSKVYEYVA